MNFNFPKLIRRTAQICMACLVLYIIFANLTPFGASAALDSSDSREISKLGPANRVETVTQDGADVSKQIDDLAYFTTTMPFLFENAQVKINFENPYPDQELLLGFQDQPSWHYNSQVLDSPLIDSLNWNKLGSDPYLYQRTKIYNSVDDFLNNPPNELIGLYGTNQNDFINDQMVIPGYKPKEGLTTIQNNMRGSETFYVYLENEPFHMEIAKQDLNWYEDPDVADVKIYKGKDMVMETQIGDDGDTSASKKAGQIQVATIDNPGPGLPENGIYKVVIDAPGDTIIKGIRTNLSKIVWQGPIYLASNANTYPGVFDQTQENVLYSSSVNISAKTSHNSGLQTIKAADKDLNLTQVNQENSINIPTNSEIRIPKSDVVLNGSGYFVFSRDQYFAPTKINTIQINDLSDFADVNYVLTNVQQSSIKSDGSRTAVLKFDIKSAYLNKGRLSWLIQAPALKENNRSVLIKKIEINMDKKGWFQ